MGNQHEKYICQNNNFYEAERTFIACPLPFLCYLRPLEIFQMMWTLLLQITRTSRSTSRQGLRAMERSMTRQVFYKWEANHYLYYYHYVFTFSLYLRTSLVVKLVALHRKAIVRAEYSYID